MGTQSIDKYRTISTNQLVRAIVEAKSSSERFCFIFGSGASASSNIPTGGELERRWMAEMEENPGLGEIRAVAEGLREEGHLEYDFKEIEEAWQNAKASGDFLSSKYYFDIYKLRFFPNHRNGYHYLERIMANAKPSFGYHPLEKAIALIPESPNPYKHCGVAWKKGDMEKALAYLTKAIKLDPEYEEAYRERADAFRRIGEEIKAAADDKAADDMSAG